MARQAHFLFETGPCHHTSALRGGGHLGDLVGSVGNFCPHPRPFIRERGPPTLDYLPFILCWGWRKGLRSKEQGHRSWDSSRLVARCQSGWWAPLWHGVLTAEDLGGSSSGGDSQVTVDVTSGSPAAVGGALGLATCSALELLSPFSSLRNWGTGSRLSQPMVVLHPCRDQERGYVSLFSWVSGGSLPWERGQYWASLHGEVGCSARLRCSYSTQRRGQEGEEVADSLGWDLIDDGQGSCLHGTMAGVSLETRSSVVCLRFFKNWTSVSDPAVSLYGGCPAPSRCHPVFLAAEAHARAHGLVS